MTQTERLPNDVVFACAYDLDLGVDVFQAALFFRRANQHDELWTGELTSFSTEDIAGVHNTPKVEVHDGVIGLGCVQRAPSKGEKLAACLSLLERYLWGCVGFAWPTGFLVGGLIREDQFKEVVECVEKKRQENKKRARQSETEIISVARELTLHPKPLGIGPDAWLANCPGKNHRLLITAAPNSFGCPWCKRKGGPEELRAFVKERREQGRGTI